MECMELAGVLLALRDVLDGFGLDGRGIINHLFTLAGCD